MSLLILDPRDLSMARAAGLDAVVDRDPSRAAVQAARAVLLGRDDDGVRLRAWRVSGVLTPAVVHAPLPGARAAYEPFATLREATASGLEEALASLSAGDATVTFRAPRGQVDLRRRRLTADGVDEPLSKLEADLLGYLYQRAGRDVSREELLVQVWGHKRAGATRSVDMAVSRLRRKLELDPSAPSALLTARGGGYRLVADPVVGPAPLPPRDDTFVGRAELLQRLTPDRLAADRITVLIGARGAGKSRVAREVAARGADRWPGGVLHCDLGGCADTPAVVLAVSAALAVQPEPRASPFDVLAAISRAAAARPATLVVLDDVDGVPSGAASVAEALASGQVAVVVTCRARLGLPRARHVEVAPLAASEADDLMRDRAEARGTAPGASGATLPVLIELAAAGGLASPGDDVVAGVVRWLDSLEPAVRATVEELAVFRGSFTRAAATAVVSDRRGLEAALTELAGSSVVQVARGGRLQLLGTVREVIAERGGARAEDARLRHMGWAAAFAARTLPSLDTFDGHAALSALRAEASNLAAAFEVATVRAPDAAPGLARALVALHLAHGSPQDAVALAHRARDGVAARGGAALVDALRLVGETEQRVDVVRAVAPYTEAAELATALGDARGAAAAWLGLSTALQWKDGPAAALPCVERAAAFARDAGDPGLAAEIETQAAFLAAQTGAIARPVALVRVEAARAILLEAGLLRALFLGSIRLAHLARNAGDDARAATVRRQLVSWGRHLTARRLQRLALVEAGQRHFLDGEPHEALRLYDEAVTLARAHGDASDVTVHHHRGMVLFELRLHEEAAEEFAFVRRLAREGKRGPDEAHACEGLALVALERGAPEEAARYAREGLEVARTLGDALLSGFLEAQLGLAEHLAGDPAAADARYARIDIERAGMLAPRVLGRRAAAAIARGDLAAARGFVARLGPLGAHMRDVNAVREVLEAAIRQEDLAAWGDLPHGHEVRLVAAAVQRGQTR